MNESSKVIMGVLGVVALGSTIYAISLYKDSKNNSISNTTSQQETNLPPNQTHNHSETNYFTSFGELEYHLNHVHFHNPSVTRVDLDGDGDKDIIVVSSGSYESSRVYENRIPQKNSVDDYTK